MGKLVRQLGNIEKHLHKKEIIELATSNAQAIIDNENYDLLKVYVELKRYETYLKGLIDTLKQPALNKAAEKQAKSFEYNEARVNISTRTKWNFSVDNKWSELDQQIQQLTKEKKEREKYLKENNESDTIVDKETGEITENFELPKEIEYGLTIRL
ncbi:MAG: hypothetical protein R6U66_14835 [Bacteroidales bacterium]